MPSKKVDKNGHYIYKWQVSTISSILTNEKYKGEAILQKTFISDYLTHKQVKNDGKEIPIYHVRDSHPFIIPPEEWEMVQVEMKRREKRYSGLSFIGSKIICGDCGSAYGQKVWHSTDKYRRMIYRCNHKFATEKHCKTPTITEEIIKKAFAESCSKLESDNLIEDLKLGLVTLDDHKELDARIMELIIECDALNDAAKKLVESKKKGTIDYDDADTKYNTLVKRHKEISSELQKLENQRSLKVAAANRNKMLIRILENNEIVDGQFQEKLWTMLLEKAVVHRDRSIEFCYYSGYKNVISID